jgi:hypothetical protein
VATKADGGAVREDDAEPEPLDNDDMELKDREVLAIAVKRGFDLLHAEVERTFERHNERLRCAW